MQNNIFQKELINLEKENLLRKIRIRTSIQAKKIFLDGKTVLNFSSNDYLGLANDKRLKQAAVKATNLYGTGSGASRLISGTHKLHKELEEKIAKFKKTQSALIFNSGYQANIGIISAIAGKGDLILSDRFNHASIVDGIILSRAEFIRYPHNDISALENILRDLPARLAARLDSVDPRRTARLDSVDPRRTKRAVRQEKKFKRKLIITDTIFSMDGDIAKLPELVRLKEKYNCFLMVDEAHATGILGKNGAGAVEHFDLEDKADLEMGTFSKAFGSFGAYVCGSKILIDYLINKCRAFIYTTSLPPAVIAANIEALKIIKKEKKRREKLWENAIYTRESLQKIGFNTLNSQTPIIPILIGEAKLAMEFSQRLFKKGIFTQAIRPPTVPAGTSRLRLSITSSFSKKDLDFLLTQFKKIGRELKII